MNKVLADLMESINKKHGMNAIRSAKEIESTATKRISTGSYMLDDAFGGGVPIGRMITIAGNYSTYKSTLCYHTIRNFQRTMKKQVLWEKFSTKDKPVYKWVIAEDGDTPLTAAIIQSEAESYTNEYAELLGIDVENLLVVYPESMEEGLEISLELQKSGVELIVHDSYTAYTPKTVLDKETGDTYQMGIKPTRFQEYHGRYQAVNNYLERRGFLPCTIIAICQLREKIGGYGNPEYISGGRSILHTESIELRMRKGDYISLGTGEAKQNIGQTIKFKVEKNKTYKQYQTGEFDMYFDEGGTTPRGYIDNAKELIVLAMLYGFIERRGAWFYYNGEQLAQGEANSIERIRTEPALFETIKNQVLGMSSIKVESTPEKGDLIPREQLEQEDDLIKPSTFRKKAKK